MAAKCWHVDVTAATLERALRNPPLQASLPSNHATLAFSTPSSRPLDLRDPQGVVKELRTVSPKVEKVLELRGEVSRAVLLVRSSQGCLACSRTLQGKRQGYVRLGRGFWVVKKGCTRALQGCCLS